MNENSIDYLMPNLNEAMAIVVKPARHIRDEDMTLKWTSKDDMGSVFPKERDHQRSNSL